MKKATLFLLLSAMLLSLLVACQSGGDRKTTDAVTALQTEGETAAESLPETDAPADFAVEAAAFDALIAKIDGATIENEKAIDAAYLTYWTMSEEARAAATRYDELLDLRAALTKAYVVKNYKDTRIPHERFLIGTYGVPGSDDDMKSLVDAHFDFGWGRKGDTETLDRYAKYGLGTFLAAGYLGIPVDTHISEEDFRAAVEGKTVDHEAIWLIDHRDEPWLLDIERYWRTGKIISEELAPDAAFIMNLLPYQGSGVSNVDEYRRYLEYYFGSVGTENDIVCFDNYPYSVSGDIALTAWLTNLDIVSDFCYRLDKDMYVIAQINTPQEDHYSVSSDMLRFQAYSTMAYGCKSITWACWVGWWTNNIIDADGNKTEQYDKAKEVNAELKALEPIYMRYTADSNAVVSGEISMISRSKLTNYGGATGADALSQTVVTDLTAGEKNSLLVGHYHKNVGEGDAFLFVGLDVNNFMVSKNQKSTASFRTVDPNAVVTAYVKGIPTLLTPDETGVYTVEIRGADAVFVTVD